MKVNLIIFSLILSSCGGVLKKTPSNTLDVAKLQKSFTPINYGPTKRSSQFIEASSSMGLDRFNSIKNYFVDINDDGLLDLVILPDYYSTPIFLEQTRAGFAPSKTIFFEDFVKASYLIFEDFDKDGQLDVLVGVHNQKTELSQLPLSVYSGHKTRGNIIFKRNNQYNFKDKYPVTSVVPLDFDYDGKLDFFLANWYDLSNPKKPSLMPDVLFHFQNNKLNNVSKSLIDEAKKNDGEYLFATPTFGVSHCDLNDDDQLDILTTNSSGYANKLWLGESQQGRISFSNKGIESRFAGDLDGLEQITGNGNSTYSLCNDYNNDGIMDIALGETSRVYDDPSRDHSSILTGEGLGQVPTFIRTDYTSDKGLDNWNQSDNRGVWFDYNNDGLLDLLVENSGFPPDSRLILFKQFEDHSFADVAPELGIDIVNPSGVIVGDVNNDGLNDIIVSQDSIRDSQIHRKIYFFKNNNTEANSYLKIKLNGKKSNSSAIGAKIKVKLKNGTTQLRYTQYTYGPLASQNSNIEIFGLGKSEAELIEVTWPYKENGKILKREYKPPFITKNGILFLEE